MALLLDDATGLIHGHGFAITYELGQAAENVRFGVHGAESCRIVATLSKEQDRTPVSYEVKQGGDHRPEFTVTEASTIAAHHPGGHDMAADHDAHDEHHDANDATNHDPPRKRWVTERADDELTRRARARNLDELAMAVACAPHGDDDVDSHAAAVATRIGSGKAAAIDYCDIGIMLRRMPGIQEFCRSGALPLWHLKKMAAAVIAVSDEHIAAVETHFLEYLRPRRDFQALPGIRVWARELRRIVESVEPISAPPDADEESASIRSEPYSVDNGYPGDHGELHVILRKDRLAEFDAATRAIRDAKISAGQDCFLGDALMHMCRGDFAGAGVTLNVYAEPNADDGDL